MLKQIITAEPCFEKGNIANPPKQLIIYDKCWDTEHARRYCFISILLQDTFGNISVGLFD